jgi:16S rRNA (cytosine1402-N4)-methyltransferase
MLDLGLSSEQLESSGRGFSFMRNEPLLMTMVKDPDTSTLTARDIVNTWQEEMLHNIISGFGEERYAKRIARKITEARKRRGIETTWQLVEIIRQAVPISYQRGRLHFATKTFQALRIAVNDEINSLKEFLQNGFEYLAREGRMAIICFHSVEDRMVKNFNREKQKAGRAKIITKKPIVPSFDEIKDNPRSRSAKLRILEKL